MSKEKIETEIVEETTAEETKKPSAPGRKTKYKKLMPNAFALGGEVYSDEVVEISVASLSDVDKKRLERSIELGMIEKA